MPHRMLFLLPAAATPVAIGWLAHIDAPDWLSALVLGLCFAPLVRGMTEQRRARDQASARRSNIAGW